MCSRRRSGLPAAQSAAAASERLKTYSISRAPIHRLCEWLTPCASSTTAPRQERSVVDRPNIFRGWVTSWPCCFLTDDAQTSHERVRLRLRRVAAMNSRIPTERFDNITILKTVTPSDGDGPGFRRTRGGSMAVFEEKALYGGF